MNKTMKPLSDGFTLIELMITIAILAIVVTIAMPSFSTMVRNNGVTTVADDLFSSLQIARSESVNREVSMTVAQKSTGWQTGWDVFEDKDNNGVFNNGTDTMINAYTTTNSQVIVTPQGKVSTNTTILYTPTGRTLQKYDEVNDYFSVTVANATDITPRCVFLSTTGRPFVQRPGEGKCP